MKITYKFRSLASWESLETGERLVRLLRGFGLEIDKADVKEPIRRGFDPQTLKDLWIGRGLPGKHATCYFLFRGQHPGKFSGMVTWHKDLPPTSTLFNTFYVDLTVSGKTKPRRDRLVALGDGLFEWSQAVHGFATDESLYNPLAQPPEKRLLIPGMFWLNYFGSPYIARPEFRLPDSAVTVSGGVRVELGEAYDDPDLSNPEFVRTAQESIGSGWFGEGSTEQFLIPEFDFSAVCRR